MQKTTKGFTLIELIIVVGIIAIISAIAIPAYTGYIKTAKMSEAYNNLAALRLAEEEYFTENNSYFFGTTTAILESNSSGLWTAAKGGNGLVNFKYEVTNASSWTATATGDRTGTSTFGESVSISK